jgi:hypothetical protein
MSIVFLISLLYFRRRIRNSVEEELKIKKSNIKVKRLMIKEASKNSHYW